MQNICVVVFFKDNVVHRTVCRQPSSLRLLQAVRRAQKPNKRISFPLCRPTPESPPVVVPPFPPSFSSFLITCDVRTDSTLRASLLNCTTLRDHEALYGRSCDQPKCLYKVQVPTVVDFLYRSSRISPLAPVILCRPRDLCAPRLLLAIVTLCIFCQPSPFRPSTSVAFVITHL